MTNKNINIYVVCHKKASLPFKQPSFLYPFFKYIEVGSNSHKEHFCKIHDDDGDSISNKNSKYDELTAQYWIWKNDHISDIVGLCHYRRYFKDVEISDRAFTYIKLLKPRKIESILQNYDFIGVKTGPFETSCRERIATSISALREKDIFVLKDIIDKKYGKVYSDAFDVVLDRNWNYLYNMIITSKNMFDSYSEWLFSVLEELEKRVNEDELVGQEKRIYGLWAEYLFDVYAVANNYRVYDSDFLYFDI